MKLDDKVKRAKELIKTKEDAERELETLFEGAAAPRRGRPPKEPEQTAEPLTI
jgi:hypothetical protein